MTTTYEEACANAATRQGLDPAVAALDAAGIPNHVWQSGGFCMVLTVPFGEDPDRYIGITNDSADPDEFLVCDSLESQERDDVILAHAAHAADLPRIIREAFGS